MKFELSYQNELRLLEPQSVRLFRSVPGDRLVRLTLFNEQSWYDVRIARALPFSNPNEFYGLRDSKDKEIGMLRTLEGLDAEFVAVVQEELDRRYFTPVVQAVLEAKEEFGTISWVVETNRGQRRFVVRNLRDSSYVMGPDRLMLTDTEGNRYELPHVSQLSTSAVEILNKVI